MLQSFIYAYLLCLIFTSLTRTVSSGCAFPDSTFIDARVSEKAASIPGDAGPVTGDDYYSCLAVDQNSLSNYTSLLATFTFSIDVSETFYARFALDCVNATWIVHNSTDLEEYPPSPAFLNATFQRTDCYQCRLLMTDIFGCVPCNASCPRKGENNATGFCYGPLATDCCPYIHDGVCVTECPTNFTHNSSSNCVCAPNYSGLDCSVCELTCGNGRPDSTCSVCECDLDYFGSQCEIQHLPCNDIPCKNGGVCTDGIGPNNYTCGCINMWSGVNCTQCGVSGCQNGGSHNSTCTGCTCVGNWNGALCDTCGLPTCQNGGSPNPTCTGCMCVGNWNGATCQTCGLPTCQNGGSHNSTCTGCSCTDNWIGATCQTCGLSTCQNGGSPNSTCTGCSCAGNWIGALCDTCGLPTCLNGGSPNPTCTGCMCVGNWNGATCQTCGLSTCQNGGSPNPTCTGCSCAGNWIGALCDTCGLPTCLNGGSPNPTCTGCMCVGNWNGATCQTCGLPTCQNGGSHNSTCTGCSCAGNWIGGVCETCGLSTCQNGGTHNPTCTGCSCTDNWIGATCQTCGLSTCQNGGSPNTTCTGCMCVSSWGGGDCSQCQQSCSNGGTPNPTCSGCNCMGEWVGTTCDTCDLSTQCEHGTIPNLTCTACQCPTGLTGQLCDQDANLCLGNPCGPGGICTDLSYPQTYNCTCAPSYELTNTPTTRCVPVNRCDSNPCHAVYSLACTDLPQDFMCTCVPDTTGKDCSLPIDDCMNVSCLYTGRCIDGNGTYSCECVGGSTGVHCETCNISCSEGIVNGSCECESACDSSPCMNGGVCSDSGSGFQCDCTGTGFTGADCSLVFNPCDPNPCKNGGSCQTDMNGYVCTCAQGFQGVNCSSASLCGTNCNPITEICESHNSGYRCNCKSGFILGLNGECLNINECQTFPCHKYANCSDTFGSYDCVCGDGFEGDGFMCNAINECSVYYPLCGEYPARCVDQLFKYECICPPGYNVEVISNATSPYCNESACKPKFCTDKDECAIPDICGPNQECINTQGGYICQCEQGFFPGNGLCVSVIGLLLCKSIRDGTGTTFPDTTPGVTVQKQCPNTEYGLISRTCLPSCDCTADSPQWGYSNVEECISPELDIALNQLRRLSITKSASQSELESSIQAVWLLARNGRLQGMDLELAVIFIQEVEQVVEDWPTSLSLGISSLEQLLNVADSLLSNSAESWEETDNTTHNLLSIVDTIHKIASRVSIYLYEQSMEYYSFSGVSFSFNLLTWDNYTADYAGTNLHFPTQSNHSINLPYVDLVRFPSPRTPQQCQSSLLLLRIASLAPLLNAPLTGSVRKNPCINLRVQTPSQQYEFQGEYISASATPGICQSATIDDFLPWNQFVISLPNSHSYHEAGRTFLNTQLQSVESFVQSQQAYTPSCTITSSPTDAVVQFECGSSNGYIPLLISPIQAPIPSTTLTLTLVIKCFLGVSALCCVAALIIILFRIYQYRQGIGFVRVNVILTISIAFVVFLVGIDRSEVEWVCTVFGILMQYFAFCSTLWALLDMINVILVVTKNKKVFYDFIFACVGYLLPLVPIPFSVGFNLCSYQRARLYCWPSSETGFHVHFAITVPLYLVVIFAIVLSVVMIVNTFYRRSEFRERSFQRCVQFLSLHVSSCTLPFLLAITWILATYGFDKDVELVGNQIVFIVFSSLTGFFCLVVYCIVSSEKSRFSRSKTGRVRVDHGSEPGTNETRIPSKARTSLINPVYTEEDERRRASTAYSSHKLPQNEIEDLEIFIQKQESLLIPQN